MRLRGVRLTVSSALGKLSSGESREAVDFMTTVTGQKAVCTRAKRSVSNFSVRRGMLNGVMVTLRDDRAVNFLRKVTLFVMPVDSTFKGLSRDAVRGRILNFGLRNLYAFPEVSEATLVRGMNLSLVCRDGLQLAEVMDLCGVPFRD